MTQASMGFGGAPQDASFGSQVASRLGQIPYVGPGLGAAAGTGLDILMHPGQALAEAPDYWLGKRRMALHGEQSADTQDATRDPDYPMNQRF